MEQGRRLAQQEMATTAPPWIDKWIEKGKLAGQREVLQKVLCHYFPVTPRQQEWFGRAFASIANTEQLTHLLDQLLNAPTLAAFEQAVLACLPRQQKRAPAIPRKTKPEADATTGKTLAQQWFEKGFKLGIERGKLAGQRGVLQQLLPHYFSLTTEQQEEFVRHFVSIENAEHLAHLVDQLLTVPTLAAFEQAVLACLPPTEQR